MAGKSELSALVSSAKLVFVGGFVGAGSQFAERIVIGRFLSPTAYGEVSIGIAILTFTTTMALAGLSQGVPRFLSRYDDERDVRGIWFTGFLVSGGLGLVLSAVLFFSGETVAAILFEEPDSSTLIALFVLAIPFVIAQKVAVAGIRGHENTIYRTYTKDLLYPLSRIALLVVLLASGYGLVAAGWAYLFAAVLTAVVAHWLLNRLVSLLGPVRLHVRELMRFSVPLIVSTVLTVLLMRTDTLMLAYFRSSAEVGQYTAAYPIAGSMLVVLSAFGYLYLPMASRLDADGERETLDNIYTITTKWVYIITFPALLTFVVFPADIMRIFFGAAYTDAARVLPVLAVGFFISVAVGRDRETLAALGDTRFIMYANAAGFTVNVLLNLLLIPRYSFVGAGFTSMVSFGAVHGVVTFVLWRRYGIVPLSPESIRTFVALPLAFFPLVVLLSERITINIYTLFPFLSIVGLLSLLLVAVVGGFRADDRVALEFVESAIGEELPVVRRYIPEE